MGQKICAILQAFHLLNGSDFTKPFFGRSKINSFKKLLAKSESMDSMSSMNTDHVDIEKVTHFVLHVINKNHLEMYVGKGEKKCAPTKSLPPDQKSLTMKILPAHLGSHSWVNCLYCNYQSLDLLSNGWIFVDGALQPFWYERALLASEGQIQSYLREKSEVLRGILQENDEIDENLTDNDEDVVSDNESESNE